jgi:DNA invertase Pin-like site-specific DNA recombinase
MKYGYIRVSTRGQASEGNGLEAQREALKAAGAEKLYEDVMTGRVVDRPAFDEMLAKVQSGDEIMVTKLDRFARSVTQASELIGKLLDDGVTVYVLNVGKLDNSPSGKLMRNMLLAFAEFERDLIVERTQEGKAIARQKPGYREGRPPKFSRQQIEHALDLLDDHSYGQVSEMTGISKSTLVRKKRERVAKNKNV